MENNNEKDNLLIERYFDGDLSAEEQAVFAQRRATDPSFSAEIEAYQQAITAIERAGRQQAKARLQAHSAQKTLKRRKILRGWLMGLAAAATLFIGWLVSGNFASKRVSTDEAFDTAFVPFESGGAEKGGGAVLTRVDSAYLAYDAHNWQNAAQLFDKLNNPTPKTRFLKANAYIALHDLDKAIPILNDLQSNAEFVERREQVEWLIALCQLKKGHIEALKNIANTPNHLFSKRAKDILTQLK